MLYEVCFIVVIYLNKNTLYEILFKPTHPHRCTAVQTDRTTLYLIEEKEKVKFTLEQAMMEQRYSSIFSLTSALDGGRWITQSSGRFTPGNNTVAIV